MRPGNELHERKPEDTRNGMSLSIDPDTLLVVDCTEELSNALGGSANRAASDSVPVTMTAQRIDREGREGR